MVVRAVVFDIGGVLERVEDPDIWLGTWRQRLGMEVEELRSAAERVDPDGLIGVGGMTEDEHRQRWAEALGLSESLADEFMRGLWDWYCGDLDDELMAYATDLRPTYRTAILSNSGPGAREQEEARYAFSRAFDPIIYSHEVGMAKPDPEIYALTCDSLGVKPHEVVFLDDTLACVDAAGAFGINAVLHESTPASIQAIDGLLAG